MAGIKGNIAWLLAAKQASKGTVPAPSATNAFKMPMSGGGISPTRTVDRLSETDATRESAGSFVTSSGVEGTPEFYVRDNNVPFWLRAGMGAIATTGAAAPFTHTITPAETLPYISLWRNIGNTLYEEYMDCKVGSVTISADAGAPLTVSASVMGRRARRLTAAPDAAAPIAVENGAVYNFNDAAVTLGGGATSLVSSFELTVENNLTAQQTDDVQMYDVVEGQREVSLSFDYIFESLDEYNKFHYGGAAGTEVSPSVFTTSAIFTFTLGAGNEISFNLPSIAYEEFPVDADPGGDPIVVSVRAVSQRSGSSSVTATVKNSNTGAAY